MAAAPRAPPGPREFRGASPLSSTAGGDGEPPGRGIPPFRIDEARLYDVTGSGTAWTSRQDPEIEARRLRRLRWLFALGVGINALTWTLAGAALVLGGQLWGAGFGLLAVATSPLLLLPALVEAAARWRARKRHSMRPEDFPPI